MTVSVGRPVSVGSGVVGLVVTNLCSYGDVAGGSSVQIVADSGDRSGEIV